MAKLVIDVSNSPDDRQEIEVSDFAEATWELVADLANTADPKWSVEVLREWLTGADPDSGKFTVTKSNNIDGTGPDTSTFQYDPS